MRVDKKIHGKNLKDKIKERVSGKIDVQLGKNGITEAFVNELKIRLEKHGVVKIRVLKSFREVYMGDIKSVAKDLAKITDSQVYEIRGFTIILIKEK